MRFALRLTLLLFLVGAGSILFGQVPAELKYIGSSTVGNFIREAEAVYGKAKFEIDTEPESAGGEQAILEGRCDIAGVAKIPRSEILAKGMVSTLFGWDAIAVITHPDNPVKNLTKEQLKGIFSGEITNWNEVGGKDQEIHSYIVGLESATRKVFRSIILGEKNYANNTVVKPDVEIIEQVAQDPAGIGHISFSFLQKESKVQAIGVDGLIPDVNNPSYPIKRPLYLLWWPGRSSVANFVDWTVSPIGQKVVKQRFVGISQGIVRTLDELGSLTVFTQTSVVEDGGIFYYPHKPYEILNPDRTLLQRVTNSDNINDETPTKVPMVPGVYIIVPEMEDGSRPEFFVTIEPAKSTTVDIESLLLDGTQPVTADLKGTTPVKKEKPIDFFGDFRFRGEHDWDSRRMDGSYRGDRTRMRYRFRLGMSYKWNDFVSVGARIRTGIPTNMQSPHFNVGYFGFTSVPFQLDRAYLEGRYKRWWWWAGKHNFPFWKQNELWWDDDVNPEGLTMGASLEKGRFKFFPTAAYFIANHDHNGNIVDGTLAAGQLAGNYSSPKLGVTVASGYYQFDNIYNVPESDNLFTGNRFKMDYQLVNTSLQVVLKGKIPITIGLDHMINLADYDGDSLIVQDFWDQKSGFVGSILVGQLKKKGDWMLGYYFASKQELSVVSYFAEDDWVRWGNINRNRNTNYSGHELRASYSFGPKFNVVVRGYSVVGLVTTGTAKESGNRIRVDVNMKF